MNTADFSASLQLTIDALGYFITLIAALIVALPLLEKFLPNVYISYAAKPEDGQLGGVRAGRKIPRWTVYLLLASLVFAISVMAAIVFIQMQFLSGPITLHPTGAQILAWVSIVPFILFAAAMWIYVQTAVIPLLQYNREMKKWDTEVEEDWGKGDKDD